MKLAKMFSSILSSGSLASGALLFLAGCSSEVKIDADMGSDPEEAEENSAVNCHVKLMPVDGLGPLSLSNHDRTAAAQETMSIAKASAGQSTGKWYFEVHIDKLNVPSWEQNVGAAASEVVPSLRKTGGMGVAYNTNGPIDVGMSDDSPGVDSFRTGDRIGVALDLDGSRVYFRKNGAWQSSDPAAGTGGAEIINVPGTGAYYPFLSLSKNDQMTANFGERKFADPAPPGFLPYGSGFVADSAGNCQDLGPVGLPSMPGPMTATCSDFDSYNAGSAGGTEMHIIGVYGPLVYPNGQINVQVDRRAPLVLVLTSYDAVQWNVTASPGTQIERIVLSSYDPSTASAPPEIPIDSIVYDENDQYPNIAYAWPNDTGGGNTQRVIKDIEAETGLKMTSFGGCYTGESFTLTD
jgi:hypothetical protein